MEEQGLFALAVAIAVVVIIGRVIANRLDVPEAIVLVVLGVLASLIPQVPNIVLPPDVVLLIFLPPLIYNAAFLSASRRSRSRFTVSGSFSSWLSSAFRLFSRLSRKLIPLLWL